MAGGLVWKPTRKDYIAEKVFGVSVPEKIVPLGRLEKVKESSLAKNIIHQGKIPSCVTCAATWINMYNSLFHSQNDVLLSWVYLFAKVPHFAGGTIPQDVLNVLKKLGQTEDGFLTQEKFWNEPFWAENPNIVLPYTGLNAAKYKISSYFFFEDSTIENLYPYLKTDPLMIGVRVVPETWKEGVVIPPTTRNDEGFNHAVVLLDVDENENLVVPSWDKKDALDIRVLDKKTEILFSAIIKDLPDGVKTQDIRRGFPFRSYFCSK